jgi:hypothetical protein
MASYAAITLYQPATILDRAWALNPIAHAQLSGLGKVGAVPFAVVAVMLLLAGIGWLRCRYWGWLLGVALIATNLAGDVANLAMGNRFKGGIGIVIAGLLLTYMTRPGVRQYFLPRLD